MLRRIKEPFEHLNPAPEWDSTYPYKLQDLAINNEEITDGQLIEELLDILLFINSPFISFKNITECPELDYILYEPSVVNYHPALGILHFAI